MIILFSLWFHMCQCLNSSHHLANRETLSFIIKIPVFMAHFMAKPPFLMVKNYEKPMGKHQISPQKHGASAPGPPWPRSFAASPGTARPARGGSARRRGRSQLGQEAPPGGENAGFTVVSGFHHGKYGEIRVKLRDFEWNLVFHNQGKTTPLEGNKWGLNWGFTIENGFNHG